MVNIICHAITTFYALYEVVKWAAISIYMINMFGCLNILGRYGVKVTFTFILPGKTPTSIMLFTGIHLKPFFVQ